MSRHTQRLRRTAQRVFGWDELRTEQLAAMEQVMAGRDVLAVLPTGAGKSAIYQVPAVLRDGPTLVVSPLLALQHDQIESLDRTRAPEAVAVNSAVPAGDRREAWAAIRDGEAEYLFLSPEQLAKEEVVAHLAGLELAQFVVDEAHCVSAWGHDFRPDYLRLAPVIERLGHPPVVALTATAALPVRRDIVARLGLRDPREVIGDFDRPELHLGVARVDDDDARREAVVACVGDLQGGDGCGLVYTASRKDAERYADALGAAGRVAAYHAGMRAADRERVHEDFLAGRLDVVVATSAFGMGIDKQDVRFVVHAAAPDSLDTYYQQIGRAGRDGGAARIVLCYRPQDLNLQRFLTGGRAPEDALYAVAHALVAAAGPCTRRALDERMSLSRARRTRALNLLQDVGAVTVSRRGARWAADPDRAAVDAAVTAAVEQSEAYQRLVRSRIEMVRGYAETTGCRRQFLLGYFGRQLDAPCGNCDTCGAGTASETVADDAFARNTAVTHAEWGPGVVMWAEPDRLTVLFDEVGYKVLARRAVEEQGLLRAPGESPAGPPRKVR